MTNFDLLKKPFPETDIEWRIQQNGYKKDGNPWGLCLAYVTNRAIMNRLDEVIGPAKWKNEFIPGPNGGVLCGLSIYIEAAEEPLLAWITKWDGADNTKIEEIKGGLSDAMKRSAVQWGIGRYLYNLDSTFASYHAGGKYKDKVENKSTKQYKYYRWDPPKLPAWALP